MDRDAYHALPEFVTVRETRIRVLQPGFRTREIVVVPVRRFSTEAQAIARLQHPNIVQIYEVGVHVLRHRRLANAMMRVGDR